MLFVISVASLCNSIFAALPDPTPAQIAAGWDTLGGGKDGLVVYNNGTEMCALLTLKTGVAKKLLTYAQANFSFSNDWGQSSGYKISQTASALPRKTAPASSCVTSMVPARK